MVEEDWRNIPEFPNYDISSHGRIFNHKQDQMMSISLTTFGHTKITLQAPDRSRHTRSVAQLVADAFVVPPNLLCDQVVVLDGDFTHIHADNLVWRPRWFAWKYTRQLKLPVKSHYLNLQVVSVVDETLYRNIERAGMTEGLLYDDIWRSTYTATPVYPTGSNFEVDMRV